jgi:phosphatidylserine/phosphatidylglycerophosphate/cardiolipin synthase-like enzyme
MMKDKPSSRGDDASNEVSDLTYRLREGFTVRVKSLSAYQRTRHKGEQFVQMSESQMELLTGFELHQRVIHETVLKAQRYVWIATANLKDMHILNSRGFRPVLEAFDKMAEQGVTFRIVHSDLPSRLFRRTLERFPQLTGRSLELQICPRSHWKMVIVDGLNVYFGSANFTGAGLGAKSEQKRNLELGVLSNDPKWVDELRVLFDSFWMGMYCERCALRKQCPDPIETR